ncbi:hypothetical protein VTN96DRAFT_10033 [Rasamsonia emersonii]
MSDPSQARPSASAYLKPPSAASARQHSPSSQHRVASSSGASSSSAAAAPPPPRPPLAIHPTATIAETAVIHGTHQISIGPGTVIHPRARLLSYEGPIQIGDGCIISEKSTIGASATAPITPPTPTPTPTSATASESSGAATTTSTPITTRLSSSVTVGPYAAILPGAYVRSACVIDSLAVVNRNATVGAHSKVCSGCEVPEKTMVEDWTVVWAAGGGLGQRRRKRVVDAAPAAAAAAAASSSSALTGEGATTATTAGGEGATTKGIDVGSRRPEGKRVEDARLIVLHKEREGLAKMIGLSSSAQRRR